MKEDGLFSHQHFSFLIKGLDVQDQVAVDNFMIKELDGTDNKGKLVTVLTLTARG